MGINIKETLLNIIYLIAFCGLIMSSDTYEFFIFGIFIMSLMTYEIVFAYLQRYKENARV